MSNEAIRVRAKGIYFNLFFQVILCGAFFLPEISFAITEKEKKKIVRSLKKSKAPTEFLEGSKRAAWFAHPLRVKYQNRIDDLYISDEKLPVFLVPTDKNIRPMVQLRMKYDREGWTLFDGEKQILKETSVENEYLVYAFLNSKLSTVQFYALGPDEELEAEMLYVYSPDAKEFKTKSIFNSLVLSAGYSYISYKQSSFGKFITNSLFFGLNYSSPFKGKRLGYYGDLSSTLYNFDSSPVSEPTSFLDGRAGLSYSTKIFNDFRYKTDFRVGVSSLNFFTFGRDFGFTGLFGLDLGMKTEFFRNGSESYILNLSLVPFDYKSIFNERTVRVEFYKSMNLKNLRKAQIGFEYSNTAFQFEIESIDMHFFGLKFGLGL